MIQPLLSNMGPVCSSQTRHSGTGSGVAMPTYSFCRQISTQEFEEQKLSVSQLAVADLLESLIKDKAMSAREKKKKLKLVTHLQPIRKHPHLSLFADIPWALFDLKKKFFLFSFRKNIRKSFLAASPPQKASCSCSLINQR